MINKSCRLSDLYTRGIVVTRTLGHALARNLRRKRLERGMSISGLAQVSGVSKATISGIERGNGNPAVDTVWALANALNTPFGALFDDDGGDLVELRRIEDAPVVSSARGFLGRRLLSLKRRGDLEVYAIEIVAGTVRNAAPHPAGVIEHVIVLEGQAEVGPTEEPTVLEQGDCLTFAADRPHQYRGIEKTLFLEITDYPN